MSGQLVEKLKRNNVLVYRRPSVTHEIETQAWDRLSDLEAVRARCAGEGLVCPAGGGASMRGVAA